MKAPDVDDPLFRLDPEAVRCPHRSYARIREEAPVAWLPGVGCYLVTRYDDVVAVARDPELFSSVKATGPHSVTPTAQRIAQDPGQPEEIRAVARRRIEIAGSRILIFADPPLHTRQRKLVNRGFSPRRVKELEEPVRRLAGKLVDAWGGAAEVEFNGTFAVGLPLSVIADALGVPRSLSPSFKHWSDAFVLGTGNPNVSPAEAVDMLLAVNAFYDYFSHQIATRRAEPVDDLLSDLVEARTDDDEPLTDHEILQALSQFLVAGNETTTKLLTATMLRLATDPATELRVREHRELIPALVEEMLRLETPAQGLFRTATRDAVLGGVAIPAGAQVFLCFAAGNRDPAFCPAPDELRLDRELPGPQLAFGFGTHFCLGASLARAEARIGLEVLLDRLAGFELAGDSEAVEYEPSFGLHGIRALPLRVTYC